MSNLYFVGDEFYTTEDEAKACQKRFSGARIDEIETSKPYEDFMTAYDTARKEGNSIADAIEWAK